MFKFKELCESILNESVKIYFGANNKKAHKDAWDKLEKWHSETIENNDLKTVYDRAVKNGTDEFISTMQKLARDNRKLQSVYKVLADGQWDDEDTFIDELTKQVEKVGGTVNPEPHNNAIGKNGQLFYFDSLLDLGTGGKVNGTHTLSNAGNSTVKIKMSLSDLIKKLKSIKE